MSKKTKRVAIWTDFLHHPYAKVEAVLKFEKDETGLWVYYKEYEKLENKLKRLQKKLKTK